MRPKILIATHHKVGTVLMKSIFSQIAEDFDLSFCSFARNRDIKRANESDILFDHSSLFRGLSLDAFPMKRGMHIVRDPRMIVVSSAYYHQTAREPWLHVSLPEFSGMTYQEKIRSLTSDTDKFIFEMQNSSGRTLRNLRSFMSLPHPWCLDVKLEVLMTDTQLTTYEQIFNFLGFSGSDLYQCLTIAYRKSVFHPDFKSRHARTRKPETSGIYFTQAVEDVFQEKFGDLPALLGYPD